MIRIEYFKDINFQCLFRQMVGWHTNSLKSSCVLDPIRWIRNSDLCLLTLDIWFNLQTGDVKGSKSSTSGRNVEWPCSWELVLHTGEFVILSCDYIASWEDLVDEWNCFSVLSFLHFLEHNCQITDKGVLSTFHFLVFYMKSGCFGLVFFSEGWKEGVLVLDLLTSSLMDTPVWSTSVGENKFGICNPGWCH